MIRNIAIGLAWISFLSLGSMFSLEAHASKARLLALGQSSQGSLFISDERNIFLNPAQMTQFFNHVNFEMGQTQVRTANQVSSPKAEGGLVADGWGDLKLGLQLGRISQATESMIRHHALSSSNFFLPQNSVDLLIAHPGDIPWGLVLHYAHSSSDQGPPANYPNSDARVVSLRGGVSLNQFTAHTMVDVIHNSETEDVGGAKQKYDGKFSGELGGSMELGPEHKLGLQVTQRNFDFDNGSGVAGGFKSTQVDFNYFRKIAVKENIFVFTTLGLSQLDQTINFSVAGVANTEVKQLSLPLVVGFESPVREWLALRASVKQSLILNRSLEKDDTSELKTEGLDDTVVRVGSSLYFGDLTLDATLAAGDNGTGHINGNNLLANASVKYNF